MSNSIKVLVNEKIAQDGIALLAERFDVTALPGWSVDELAEHIGDFDAIVVRSATKLTRDLIARATNLRVIGRAGVGVDNIDLDAATERGIVVVNAPTSTVVSVAEHALALAFALARNVPQASASIRAGEWKRSAFGGVELAGMTLAVIGMGRIGQVVAQRARALEMRVVGYDPFVAPERFERLGVEPADTMDAALAQADFATIHLPLTDATRNCINAQVLAAMKPGSRIINAARGGIVDLDALYESLSSGHLAGAALDVFPVEPPQAHPIFELSNVVCTPHIAASTSQAQARAGVDVAEQVSAALVGGAVTTAVNVPAIAPSDVDALQSYVPLATGLARLASALAGNGLTRLATESCGDLAQFDVRFLGHSALAAVLADTVEGPVSFVNVEHLAQQRGIELCESTEPRCESYRDLFCVEATAERTVSVAGTTMGQNYRPYLVGAMGFDIEIELAPNMAMFLYADVPGMIGRIGTRFGEAGVNIANMAVSRRDGQALMAVSFDREPPLEIVSAIGALDDFAWAVACSV